jgi:hypothetical protein
MTAAQEELKRMATEKDTVIAAQAKAIKEHTATIDLQQTQIEVRSRLVRLCECACRSLLPTP